MLRQLSVAIAFVALVGCASVPRDEAKSLATAGSASAQAMSGNLNDLAKDLLTYRPNYMFYEAVRLCDAKAHFASKKTAASDDKAEVVCEPYTDDKVDPDGKANFKKTEELAGLVVLRIRMYDALAGAYAALDREATYDAKGELQGAVGQAVDTVNGYAASVTTLVPAAAGALGFVKPLTDLAKPLAGLWAGERQKQRLADANRKLAEVCRLAAKSLREERKVYATVADILSPSQVRMQSKLIELKVADEEAYLRGVTESVGLTPSGDASERLAESQSLRVGARSVALAATARIKELNLAFYDEQIETLDKLAEAHDAFAEGRQYSLAAIQANITGRASLFKLMSELSTLRPPGAAGQTPAANPASKE